MAAIAMHLLQGPAAIDTLRQLEGQHMLGMALEPRAKNGGTLELMALGNAAAAFVVDVRRTPELGPYLAASTVVAAWDAKTAHRACLKAFGTGPARWACAKLSAQLLAGGQDAPCDRATVAATYDVTLPRMLDSLAALGADAQSVTQVLAHQSKALQQACMQRVSKLESRAVAAIAEMEMRGMPFDAQAWQSVTRTTLEQYQEVRAAILGHLGLSPDTNLDHDAALLRALRGCGLQVQDAKRSTLQTLPAPMGPWLRSFKTLGKRVHAYGAGYLEHLGTTGRLHPTFEQIGASTGRMACHSPNLQAMVKGTAHRACFRPSADRRLVVADYAACELRILAQLSHDPVFVEAFAHNQDVHARVASSIFHEPVSKTHKPHLRHIAKTVSFGLVYGMGAPGLARTLKITTPAAHDLMDRFFSTFPRIRGALQTLSATSQQRGWAQTRTGRRLYLNAPPYTDDSGLAARVGKNMPIQGTNADIIKLALGELRQNLVPYPDTYVVNCIHDEIVVECPARAADAVQEVVSATMIAVGRPLMPDVPLAVEARVLAHWGAD